MAYGSESEVAALTPRAANASGVFDTTTTPKLATVTTWLTQLSSMVDSMLAKEGFSVPITNTTVKPALDLFVEQEAAALVEGVNGSGRFGPSTGKGGGRGRFALMLDDVKAFIEGNAFGFEQAGATRSLNIGAQIGYRGTDDAGDDVEPIFQRKAFGNVFEDWDTD
ncbi:MAG: hypothetical protein C4575_12920 [Desulforudis sp.]|jgi:hypothetical protein|nr:MAG: hypothetical protein C4575_12920 [Desulforudis sp.]